MIERLPLRQTALELGLSKISHHRILAVHLGWENHCARGSQTLKRFGECPKGPAIWGEFGIIADETTFLRHWWLVTIPGVTLWPRNPSNGNIPHLLPRWKQNVKKPQGKQWQPFSGDSKGINYFGVHAPQTTITDLLYAKNLRNWSFQF